MFCHIKISQAIGLHAMFLVSSESIQWAKVHQFGLKLFEATMWTLLIIERLFSEKKSKLKIVSKFGDILGVVGKPLASQIE